jgi:hypothetical protein
MLQEKRNREYPDPIHAQESPSKLSKIERLIYGTGHDRLQIFKTELLTTGVVLSDMWSKLSLFGVAGDHPGAGIRLLRKTGRVLLRSN